MSEHARQPAEGAPPPKSSSLPGQGNAIAKDAPTLPPAPVASPAPAPPKVPEIGGPKGPEPTRYGDWERNGRCIDF